MKARFPLLAAGLSGATGVALGAFGAHALKGFLAGLGTTATWETAVRYQLVHAAALLVTAGWAGGPRQAAALRAARSWTAGTVLFSGSLYILALGGPRWMGPVTPLGGLCLIAGWIFVAAGAFTGKDES